MAIVKKIADQDYVDEAVGKFTVPQATETTVGGVKAPAATEAMTQPVGITPEGLLMTAPGGGSEWRYIRTVTIPEDVTTDESGVSFVERENGGCYFAFDTDENGKPFALTDIFFRYWAGCSSSSAGTFSLYNEAEPSYQQHGINLPCSIATTGKKSYGWNKIENYAGKLIGFGAWNVGSSFSNASAARDYKNADWLTDGKWTAIDAYMPNMATYGFEAGSTFEFYGR